MRNKRAVVTLFRKLSPNRCFYCGMKLISLKLANMSMSKNIAELYTEDHVEPLCLGGSNRLINKVPCCQKCNRAKGQRTIEQYRAFLYWGKMVEFYGEQLYRTANRPMNRPTGPQVIDSLVRKGGLEPP